MTRVPVLTLVVPVNVFGLLSVTVPDPARVRPVPPAIGPPVNE